MLFRSPAKGQAAIAEARHAIRDLKMMGFHFHPIMQHFSVDDARYYPLFEEIAAMKAAVMIDVGMTGMGAGMPGGMGAKTLAALKEHGAVYLNAVGGAAQFYARAIKKVDGVSLLDFGTPEAMWHLAVEEFPAIVTMDAHGNSLHKDIEQESGLVLETIGGSKTL